MNYQSGPKGVFSFSINVFLTFEVNHQSFTVEFMKTTSSCSINIYKNNNIYQNAINIYQKPFFIQKYTYSKNVFQCSSSFERGGSSTFDEHEFKVVPRSFLQQCLPVSILPERFYHRRFRRTVIFEVGRTSCSISPNSCRITISQTTEQSRQV